MGQAQGDDALTIRPDHAVGPVPLERRPAYQKVLRTDPTFRFAVAPVLFEYRGRMAILGGGMIPALSTPRLVDLSEIARNHAALQHVGAVSVSGTTLRRFATEFPHVETACTVPAGTTC
jgi:hypothetical protein